MGDCGSWVIGLNGELYGYIVYGHNKDKVAYIVSAEEAANDGHDEDGPSWILKPRTHSDQNKNGLAISPASKHEREDTTKKTDAANPTKFELEAVAPRKPQMKRFPAKLQKHKDNRKRDLKYMGSCLAYIILLGLITAMHLLTSAWTLNYRSKAARRNRKKLEALMLQSVDELRTQITKASATSLT